MPTFTPSANLAPQPPNYATKEEERFQSFYHNILNLHDLLSTVDNITLRRQLRELINKIEGEFLVTIS